jgi:predicted RNase H-like HicB family nuclease
MGITMKKRLIWTLARRGFMVMGGHEWYPVYTKIDVLESRKLKGIEFISFKTPKGSIRVAECISGGIVANGFEELIANIKDCSAKFLKAQIVEGQPRPDTTGNKKELTNEEFFALYKY